MRPDLATREEVLRFLMGLDVVVVEPATSSPDQSSPDTSQPYFLDLINRIDEVVSDVQPGRGGC